MARILEVGRVDAPTADGSFYRADSTEFTADSSTGAVSSGVPAMYMETPINWKSPFVVQLEYKTTIVRSRSGREQRRALRKTARKRFDFSVLLAQGKGQAFKTAISGWLGNLFLFSDPTKSLTLVNPLFAGATVLEVSETPYWLVFGAWVSLEYRGSAGARKVQRVEGSTIHFSDTDAINWPVGTKMAPLFIGRLGDSFGYRQYTSEAAEAALDFQVDPLSEQFRPVGEPVDYFDEVELFLKKPNWVQPLDMNIEAEIDTLDYGRGAIRTFRPENYNRRIQKARYLGRNRAEAEYVEGFFSRMRGRRGMFYTPTWENDLPLSANVVAGTNQLFSSYLEIARFLSDDPSRQRIILVTKDGRYFPNRVSDISLSTAGYGRAYGFDYGGSDLVDLQTVVTVRDPWPEDIAMSDVRAVSWLMASRLSTDMISFSWLTDSVAEFDLTFTSLEDLGDSTISPSGYGRAYGLDYGGRP